MGYWVNKKTGGYTTIDPTMRGGTQNYTYYENWSDIPKTGSVNYPDIKEPNPTSFETTGSGGGYTTYGGIGYNSAPQMGNALPGGSGSGTGSLVNLNQAGGRLPRTATESGPGVGAGGFEYASGGNMTDSLSSLYQPTALQQQISAMLLKQYDQPNPYSTGEGRDFGRYLSEMSRSGGGIGNLSASLADQYGQASSDAPDISAMLAGIQVPDMSGNLQARMNTPATQMELSPQTQALMAQMAGSDIQAPTINLSPEIQALMSRMANAEGTIDPAFQAAREAEGQAAMNKYIGNLAALNQGSIPTNAIIAGGQETARGIGRDLTQYQLQSQQLADAQHNAALGLGGNIATGNAQLLAQAQALNNARQQAALGYGIDISSKNAELSAQDQAQKNQLAQALTNLSEEQFRMAYGITKDAAAAKWQQYESQMSNMNIANQMKLAGAQQNISNQYTGLGQMGNWLGSGNQYDLSKAGLLTDLYSGEKSQQDLAMQRYLTEKQLAAAKEQASNNMRGGLANNAISIAGPYALKSIFSGSPSNTQGGQTLSQEDQSFLDDLGNTKQTTMGDDSE